MINFKDLKENTLLIAEKDFSFYVYESIADKHVMMSSISSSNNKYYKFSSNFLILLKRNSTKSISRWVCFCSGKICKFTIDEFDCERIVLL